MSMQPSPEQISEMITAMQSQCQYFKAATDHNPRDDTSFSNWGSMLMHLSMVSEDQNVKKDFLKQGIEKLERAISLNDNSKTQEGELAYFNLGNALYFAFFLEKDDRMAEEHLRAAKQKFAVAMAKEPGNQMHTQMMEQLQTAHEQRRSAHEQLAKLEGKTDEEKKVEILGLQKQMLESVVETHQKQVEKNPNNVSNLVELAKSMFELAMLCGKEEAMSWFKEAKEIAEKAMGMSSADSTAPWLHAVLLQAISYAMDESSESKALYDQAQREFDNVMKREIDLTRREQLGKEREIFSMAMKSWRQQSDVAASGAGAKSGGAHTDDTAGFLVLIGLAVAIAGAAWYLTKKKN